MEDREVRSGIRKALDQRLHQATRGLAKDLLAEEHALLAHPRREGQIQELTSLTLEKGCRYLACLANSPTLPESWK